MRAAAGAGSLVFPGAPRAGHAPALHGEAEALPHDAACLWLLGLAAILARRMGARRSFARTLAGLSRIEFRPAGNVPLRAAWPLTGGAAVALVLGAVIVQLSCGNSGSSSTPPPPSSSASVTVSSTSLTFGSQALQTTSPPQTITLTSSGAAAATISSITASGDFAQSNTCGSALAPGATCTIAVTFTPTVSGQRTGAITINSNAANSPQTVSLTGTGGAAAGPTPAGTYQIGISGTSGTLVQSGSVTLVVQ